MHNYIAQSVAIARTVSCMWSIEMLHHSIFHTIHLQNRVILFGNHIIYSIRINPTFATVLRRVNIARKDSYMSSIRILHCNISQARNLPNPLNIAGKISFTRTRNFIATCGCFTQCFMFSVHCTPLSPLTLLPVLC